MIDIKPALLSTARLNLCSFAAPTVDNAQVASLMQRVAGEDIEEEEEEERSVRRIMRIEKMREKQILVLFF